MLKLTRFAFGPLAAAAITIAAPALAQQPTTVQFGLVAKLALSWPMFMADNKGVFAEYGVKPDFVVMGNSSKVIQGLAAGSFQMGHAGIPDAIRGTEQGAPVKIIAAEIALPPYRWNAPPSIKKVADLKGKKIMLGGSKDITFIYWKVIAEKNGMAMSDFDFVYAGATNARFAALVSGAVQATLLAQPFDFQAEGQGFPAFATQKDYTPDSPFTVYATSTDWAAKNRNVVVGFLKGYLRGVTMFNDPANRKEAIDVLIKETGAKPDDAEKTYDLYTKDLKPFRTDGAMTDAAMADILKSLVMLEDLKEPLPPATKYYDDSFLKAAR
jgi:NitT/TauT family transport system substrate-binding protein